MNYLAIARMALLREAYYRFELLFNALKAVVTVAVLTAVWKAVYASRPVFAGFTLDEVIFYTCTATTLTMLFEVNLEREIGDRLRTGNLSLQLLKPVNYFLYGFSEAVGTMTYTLCVSALPTFLLLLFLFGAPPLPMVDLTAALVMTGFGFLLFFSFCHLTALTTFFTEEVWGVEYLRMTFVRFFAGGFLPLSFFPAFLQEITLWLPFPYMIYYPALAVAGKCPPELTGRVLMMQFGWGALLLLLNAVFWKGLVKHVTIHGG